MENIEFEYKLLISKEQFEKLVHELENIYTHNTYDQLNIYYDSNNQDLKNSSSALRIREKNNKLEYTFKQKLDDDLKKIEIKANASSSDLNMMPDKIRTILQNLEINIHSLKPIAKIKTRRIDYSYHGSVLSLDISLFNDKIHDYELELEVDKEESIIYFKELLEKHNIKYIQSKSKIYRAIKYKDSISK